MIKVEFEKRLTALEVREPIIAACEDVARELGIYAVFRQHKQPSLSGRPGDLNRQRIGNDKHRNWFIDYQEEEPGTNRPTVIGRVVIASAFYPSILQFGGFDYGGYGPNIPNPRYRFITVDVPTLTDAYPPIRPSAEMTELTYDKVEQRFPDATTTWQS